ncbi:DNA polymerase III subunit gamma and tau [Streptomyces mobaraensis NBRC 13819 = DSM 40847]|uniref:DNA polymerase III subunit gamma/tau n=1 Tax=Streptomyces mobaraensis (strain ATCC 29032 / DSM 40847 / JCM 4168 / NBRC 13819 / NCIMB 11159 / IPCR 16-22) TaxID=1223523 RepID=M3BQB9_STRM1|nr:DNA polymerase III subunit gamma and tau [Streptomyces mobaraensis]EMF01890.1 DNA polymerase III subunits gamma and tau [Streptomyces mobaraensis NBRC 13819 = DSM 40847]QTT74875.1 DNA polymerase III subunit gamma and tau [Streptomyces mobaraensis NBRC 13819 = DSM 40847]
MSSLALYRRYRPESFAEVIGQEHVTAPLQQALRNNRVNHAYLFSGPRGCGKTTSARILARCLNCEEGPTPTPCGQCQSCRDLARNGRGSIDVIEIDAASHGGVDDARELREKAFFGPASSRYKIYIIDEAHMVTSAGFNALLKVVEEPPEHLKFIFATTEPEKVIGTIRSRTHHYPFRLVPPGTLREYLGQVCEQEKIPVEDGVLPLVVRAGAGSVRDSMSVMDQLLAGAAEDGVTYAMATSLLGYTDGSLLDAVVDAFAAGDGGAAFEVVDRVIEGGNDPRRFVADLLERLRDLVILAAVPDAAEKGLIDAPVDVVERMQAQASVFGAGELSRAADLVNQGLTEMRGATSPRLQLELICARVLLPGAYDDERSVRARLDKLERMGLSAGPGAGGFMGAPQGGLSAGYEPGPQGHAPAGVPGAPGAPGLSGPAAARAAVAGSVPGGGGVPGGAQPAAAPAPSAPAAAPAPAPAGPVPVQPDAAVPQPGAAAPRPGAWPTATAPGQGPAAGPAAPAASTAPAGGTPGAQPGAWPTAASPQQGGAQPGARPGGWPTAATPATPPAQAPQQQPQQAQAPQPQANGGGSVDQARQMWPQILDAVKNRRRFTWILLSQNAHVSGFDGTTLQVGFSNVGARDSFANSGSEDVLRQALSDAFGVQWKIELVVDATGGGGGGAGGAGPAAGPGGGFGGGGGGYAGGGTYGGGGGGFGGGGGGFAQGAGAPAAPRPQAAAPAPAPAPQAPQAPSGPAAPQQAAPAAPAQPYREPEPPSVSIEDDMPAEDDPDLDDTALTGHDLIIRELGATVIEEIANEG